MDSLCLSRSSGPLPVVVLLLRSLGPRPIVVLLLRSLGPHPIVEFLRSLGPLPREHDVENHEMKLLRWTKTKGVNRKHQKPQEWPHWEPRSERHEIRSELCLVHKKQIRTLWPERFEKNLLVKEAPSFIGMLPFSSMRAFKL